MLTMATTRRAWLARTAALGAGLGSGAGAGALATFGAAPAAAAAAADPAAQQIDALDAALLETMKAG